MNKKINFFFKISHQWLGLIGGWFLFILFVSGSISIFDKEVTQWMQPELALYTPTKTISNTALDQAFNSWEQHKNIRKNIIALPSSRDPFIRVLHYQDNILQGAVIHPQQGNIIPVRSTGGGYFIDSLHSNLFIGRFVGGAIVLIIGIDFILILITGVFFYFPNIIKKAFLIYPKPRNLRFKSDLHTIMGLFFLPFLFITAISGVLFLAPRYLPNTEPQRHISSHQNKKNIDQNSPNLFPLLAKAKAHFGAMPSAILFARNEIKFMENEQTRIARLKNYIAFDLQTAQISSISAQPASLTLLNKTLLGIHMVRAGDIILRTIFFFLGIGCAILVACGLLFYSTKKRNSTLSTISLSKQYFYRTIEGINIGVIMGTLIAIITLLWLNRLLPISLPRRMNWEITGFVISFFLVLSSSIFAAICNKAYYTWASLIGILSALCIFLPAIDIIQTFYYLKAALFNHNYLYCIIDSIVFLLGLVFLRLFFYIQGKGTR